MIIFGQSLLILMIGLVIYMLIEHGSRRIYDLLDEFEHRKNHWMDDTEKRIRKLLNETFSRIDHQTTEKFDAVFEKSRPYNPLQNPYGASTCTLWFGCHHGYCWSGCAGAFPSISGPEWCYTTNATGKISCQTHEDCHGCWRCSSPCSV